MHVGCDVHTINLEDESLSSEQEEEDTSKHHGEDSKGKEHPEQSQVRKVSLFLAEYTHPYSRINSYKEMNILTPRTMQM